MWSYIVNRSLQTIPVLIGVTLLTFLLFHAIPGDPARMMLGLRANIATVESLRQQWGYDQPLPVQYWRFFKKASTGDLGRSTYTNRLVLGEIADRAPATAMLAVSSMLFAIVVGIPAGVLSALRRNTWIDFGAMIVSLAGISIPIFFLAILLLWIFGYALGWFPLTGYVSDVGWLALVLPSVALGTRPLAILARLTRSSMLEVLRQDYILTARAKGQMEWLVVFRHAFRNAFNPVFTALSGSLAGLLVGSFFVEYIFRWPGIGFIAIESIKQRDLPMIQGTVLVAAFVFVVVNLLVDIGYRFLDPRVKL
ncbi:MAG: ABC transporter permease subunit [bacterium]|nr:ABC transporter permease subunit [bacterium]